MFGSVEIYESKEAQKVPRRRKKQSFPGPSMRKAKNDKSVQNLIRFFRVHAVDNLYAIIAEKSVYAVNFLSHPNFGCTCSRNLMVQFSDNGYQARASYIATHYKNSF